MEKNNKSSPIDETNDYSKNNTEEIKPDKVLRSLTKPENNNSDPPTAGSEGDSVSKISEKGAVVVNRGDQFLHETE